MSAERKIQPLDEANLATAGDEMAPLEPFVLRQQVAERLAAHRSRRTGSSSAAQTQPTTAPRSRNSRIAAAVAERYSQSKSYRDFLAEEAERAVREAEESARQAQAAAEIAARNAEALAQVQYDLLAELNDYAAETGADQTTQLVSSQICHPERSAQRVVEGPASFAGRQAAARHSHTAPAHEDLLFNPNPEPAFTAADLTVRLADEIRLHTPEPAALRSRRTGPAHEVIEEALTAPSLTDPSEALDLDDEIAFRQSPVFEPVEPPIDIPANLIEFPRQLIAARKARPRLAEGPLREEAEEHHDPSQLRIFEVEAEQLSPAPAVDTEAPEWSSMVLDAHPRHAATYGPEPAPYHLSPEAYLRPDTVHHLERSPETQHLYAAQIHPAPLQLRLMSAAVDAIAVLASFIVFIGAFVYTASYFLPDGLHISLLNAAIASGIAIPLLAVLYQYVCFTFSEATPGMRYARIGLCTFTDDNPSREAMRRRIFALVVSIVPCGLGLIWSLLDDDRLGWHDRLSGMYQRSY